MDIPSPVPSSWFAELDGEDPMLFEELAGDWLVDYPLEDLGVVLEDLRHSHSSGSECNSSNTTADVIGDSTAKRQKLNDHDPRSPITSGPNEPNNQIMSFGRLSSSTSGSNNNNNSKDESAEKSSMKRGPRSNLSSSSSLSVEQPGGTASKRPKRQPDQCHNHIIAERQRRQNLSQGFITLSALIPGLKKMDKTSVLGEAINHMKQLKERLKVLEEDKARREVESVVVVKRSHVMAENEASSCADNEDKQELCQASLPEIEARFCDKTVLIKIHCSVQKGVITNIVTQIESLNLCVSTANAMSFNAGTLDITIIAQMESEFEITPGDVVRNLRSIFV